MGESSNGIADNGREKTRRRRTLAIFAAVVLATIVSGIAYWWYRQSHISTDDAYVEGRIHPVSSRIQGTVIEVLAEDNQPVKKGQALLRIDPEPYAVRVASAASSLAAASADLDAARQDVAAGRSDIAAAREDLAASEAQLSQAKAAVEAARSRTALSAARLAQAERDAARAAALFERHSISRERNEKAQTEKDVAAAQDAVAREELRQAEAAVPALEAVIAQRRAVVGQRRAVLAQREAKIGQRSAEVKQRQSALAEAKLNHGYAEVVSPSDGYVTRKNVERGQVVSPGQVLLAVATLSDVWVVANYKETQIEKIRPGEDVDIRVDTYPGRKFRGKVDSIMAGTGSAFSLFPPENATGNYVKVVQRVPVKIVLLRGEDPGRLLRIGMSVEPTVIAR